MFICRLLANRARTYANKRILRKQKGCNLLKFIFLNIIQTSKSLATLILFRVNLIFDFAHRQAQKYLFLQHYRESYFQFSEWI